MSFYQIWMYMYYSYSVVTIPQNDFILYEVESTSTVCSSIYI